MIHRTMLVGTTALTLTFMAGTVAARAGDYTVTPLAMTGSFGSLPGLGSVPVHLDSPSIGRDGDAWFTAYTIKSGPTGKSSAIYRATPDGTVKGLYGQGFGGIEMVGDGRFAIASNVNQLVFLGSTDPTGMTPWTFYRGSIDALGNPQPPVGLTDIGLGYSGPWSPLDMSPSGFIAITRSYGFFPATTEIVASLQSGVVQVDLENTPYVWFDGIRVHDDGMVLYARRQSPTQPFRQICSFRDGVKTLVLTASEVSIDAFSPNIICLAPTGDRFAFASAGTPGAGAIYEYNEGQITQIAPPGPTQALATNAQGDYAWIRDGKVQVSSGGTITTLLSVGDKPLGTTGPMVLGFAVTGDATSSGNGWEVFNQTKFMNDAGQVIFAVFLQGSTPSESGYGVFLASPEASTCQADCDASGTLNIDDFICFQTLFALGDPLADCDANGGLNIDDFICFQTLFALGC
jgi:hypothetical protein